MHFDHAIYRRLPLALRYAIAVALVAAALTLSLAFEAPLGNPFWLLLPAAVLASTWFAGIGPGWIAVALSTIVAQYYFIPPSRSWALRRRDIPFFLSFAARQIAASRLVAWRLRIEGALREARDQLEIKVAERTAELKNANNTPRIRSLINKGAPQRESVALNRVIGDTVSLIEAQAARNKVSIYRSIPDCIMP